MEDWSGEVDRAARGLGLSWPVTADSARDDVAAFLDKKLNREGGQAQTPGNDHRLIPWAAAVFAIMERWADRGEDKADYATLDAIRAEFDRAGPVFAPLVEAGRTSAYELAKLTGTLISPTAKNSPSPQLQRELGAAQA